MGYTTERAGRFTTTSGVCKAEWLSDEGVHEKLMLVETYLQ